MFKLLILEQMSLIYCGVRNNIDITKTDTIYDSTIVHNMSGTFLSFHPTNNSTYFVGSKVGFVVEVCTYFIKFKLHLSCKYLNPKKINKKFK